MVQPTLQVSSFPRSSLVSMQVRPKPQILDGEGGSQGGNQFTPQNTEVER